MGLKWFDENYQFSPPQVKNCFGVKKNGLSVNRFSISRKYMKLTDTVSREKTSNHRAIAPNSAGLLEKCLISKDG